MQNLKWFAVPVTAIALVFLFFGLIWQAVVQLLVAVALLALAGGTWRTATGHWPFAGHRATR